ncbi:MAG: hypothetical protein FWG41_00950 [Methanomassiliicoccaceae archaeon]|nr:hypothetical protein [Methanomassiliicoccaceae archaeon]
MPLEGLWGWIPNISGDPLKDDEHYIQTQIDEYNSETDEINEVSFFYDISKKTYWLRHQRGRLRSAFTTKGGYVPLKLKQRSRMKCIGMFG